MVENRVPKVSIVIEVRTLLRKMTDVAPPTYIGLLIYFFNQNEPLCTNNTRLLASKLALQVRNCEVNFTQMSSYFMFGLSHFACEPVVSKTRAGSLYRILDLLGPNLTLNHLW